MFFIADQEYFLSIPIIRSLCNWLAKCCLVALIDVTLACEDMKYMGKTSYIFIFGQKCCNLRAFSGKVKNFATVKNLTNSMSEFGRYFEADVR